LRYKGLQIQRRIFAGLTDSNGSLPDEFQNQGAAHGTGMNNGDNYATDDNGDS